MVGGKEGEGNGMKRPLGSYDRGERVRERVRHTEASVKSEFDKAQSRTALKSDEARQAKAGKGSQGQRAQDRDRDRDRDRS